MELKSQDVSEVLKDFGSLSSSQEANKAFEKVNESLSALSDVEKYSATKSNEINQAATEMSTMKMQGYGSNVTQQQQARHEMPEFDRSGHDMEAMMKKAYENFENMKKTTPRISILV